MWGKALFFNLLCSSLVFSFTNAQISEILEGLGYLYQAYEFISEHTKPVDTKPSSEERHYLSIEHSLQDLSLKLDGLVTDIPEVTDIVHRLGEVRRKFKTIDRRYNDYLKFKQNRSLYDPSTVIDFYKKATSEMPEELFNIYDNVVSLKQHSLASLMEKYIENLDPYCKATKSRQRYFYDFFVSVVSYELKSMLTIDYAYELKYEHEKNVKLEQEMKDWKADAENVVRNTINQAKTILARADRDMWKCDPKTPIENKTFVQLKLFQRVLYRGLDFFDSAKEYLKYEECPKQRKHRGVAPIFTKPDFPLKYPLPQRNCTNVVGCNQIKSNESYIACLLNDQKTRRRYSSVNTTVSGFFKNYCDAKSNQFVFTSKTYVMYSVVERHVSCDCICSEWKDTDRFFSLEPVFSDTKKNFVITGVKFVLVNLTLHLQIQEGKLLPNGYIDKTTVRWKDLEPNTKKFAYRGIPQPSGKVLYTNEMPTYETDEYREHEGPKLNLQVFKMDWYDRRGLYLDDIEFNSTEVVTGVRFRPEKNENNTFNIRLDVRATSFNHSSGRLSEDNHIWWSQYLRKPNRTQLNLDAYDLPTLLDDVVNVPDGIPNQHTKFTPSAYTSKDAGQTTLPLIDIQPVVSDPPVPLSGISLDIKRAGISGGYLMLKTKTFNELSFFKKRIF